MRLDEYGALDGLGLARLIKCGEISAREAALMAQDAIGRLNGELCAVVETYPDRIEALDEGTIRNGPFEGAPFLIKDTGFNLKGRKCESGSRLLQGLRGDQDSYFATMLEDSGVNILGRSNVPEFCIAGTSENDLYGDTSTPWRKGFSAGGSSGGAAAAVAAGMVPLAHGSDIGGSIRIPASLCGVVGLKPSRGRISYGPSLDEGGNGMASNGVQTRTVRDTAAMLDCLSIPQVGDPYNARPPATTFMDELGKSIRGLRVAFSGEPLVPGSMIHPEMPAAVERVAETFSQLGCEVSENAPWYDYQAAMNAFIAMWFFGYADFLDELGARAGRTVGPETVLPVTLVIYESAKQIAPERFLHGKAWLNKLRRAWGRFFSEFDIWLTPTTAMPAEANGRYGQKQRVASAEAYLHDIEVPIQYCMPYNMTGFPAISLPLGMTSDGLPFGIQLGAGPGREDLLLRAASRIEEAMPWSGRTPPIHVSWRGIQPSMLSVK